MFWILAFSIALAVAGVVLLLRIATATGRARRADALARRLGLAIPPQLQGVIESRIARFTRANAIGMLLAAIVSAPIGYAIARATGDDLWASRGFGNASGSAVNIWPGAGAALVVVGVFIAASAITLRDDTGDEVRFARSTAVGLDDYIPRAQLVLLRIGTIGSGVLAALLAAVAVAAPATLPAALPLIGTGAIGVIALIVFEVFGRRIVAARQPSGSPAELAWNDALRSTQLTQLASAPGLLGYYSLLGCAFVVPRMVELGGAPGWIGGAIGLIVVVLIAAVGVLVLTLVWGRGNPQTHFLRRLWPEVAAQNAALATATTLAQARVDEGLAPASGIDSEPGAAALGSGAPVTDSGERSEGGR
ncbi:hypothetical protein [Schumannella soli]|uniref:Uncharacterized protein n=1 Tax=Schumannella soli TaxID=2590779 RepID=A0A506Y7C7_9MICO|nr:hypothetical protein [Schumannella soli]TPW77982.1 hypothetical protein FJ657_04935 [Schumannella soli]